MLVERSSDVLLFDKENCKPPPDGLGTMYSWRCELILTSVHAAQVFLEQSLCVTRRMQACDLDRASCRSLTLVVSWLEANASDRCQTCVAVEHLSTCGFRYIFEYHTNIMFSDCTSPSSLWSIVPDERNNGQIHNPDLSTPEQEGHELQSFEFDSVEQAQVLVESSLPSHSSFLIGAIVPGYTPSHGFGSR